MWNRSNPDWYEALQEEPLRSKTFTKALSTKIKDEALQPINNRKSRFRRISAIGVLAVCVAGGFLLADMPSLLQKGTYLGSSANSAMGSGGASQATEPEVSLPAAEEPTVVLPDTVDPAWGGGDIHSFDAPALDIASPTDEEWQTLINDSYPDSSTEMLYKQSIGNDRVFIFSKKVNEAAGYTAVTTVTDEFEWTEAGWKRQSRFASVPNYNLQETIDSDLLTNWYGPNLIADDRSTLVMMFSGLVVNPNITSIQLMKRDEQIHEAQILPSDDGYTYFFIALPPGASESYTLEAFDADGQLIYNEAFKPYN